MNIKDKINKMKAIINTYETLTAKKEQCQSLKNTLTDPHYSEDVLVIRIGTDSHNVKLFDPDFAIRLKKIIIKETEEYIQECDNKINGLESL